MTRQNCDISMNQIKTRNGELRPAGRSSPWFFRPPFLTTRPLGLVVQNLQSSAAGDRPGKQYRHAENEQGHQDERQRLLADDRQNSQHLRRVLPAIVRSKRSPTCFPGRSVPTQLGSTYETSSYSSNFDLSCGVIYCVEGPRFRAEFFCRKRAT